MAKQSKTSNSEPNDPTRPAEGKAPPGKAPPSKTRPSKTPPGDVKPKQEAKNGKPAKAAAKQASAKQPGPRAKQARPPKGKTDDKPKETPKEATDKWSGSTFHSSPNAASLPRPPFARTSPPHMQTPLSPGPPMPPVLPVHNLRLAPPMYQPMPMYMPSMSGYAAYPPPGMALPPHTQPPHTQPSHTQPSGPPGPLGQPIGPHMQQPGPHIQTPGPNAPSMAPPMHPMLMHPIPYGVPHGMPPPFPMAAGVPARAGPEK